MKSSVELAKFLNPRLIFLRATSRIEAPQRTVAAALRVMGLSDDRNYARYHQVLNRAVWSPREAARILLLLLLQHLDDGPLIFGIDETLERRRGPKIKSLGMYRDPFQPEPPGQGQRSALDLPDVAGPRPLGGTLLGLLGSDIG